MQIQFEDKNNNKDFIKIKKEILRENTFKIINNARSFLIFEKQ